MVAENTKDGVNNITLEASNLKASTLKKIWAAWPYMLSVSLIRCKNEAWKKMYINSIIKAKV